MTKRKRRHEYTIGSISSGTMRAEDLIPAFVSQLEHELKRGPKQDRATRKAHYKLVREVTARLDGDSYFEDGDSDSDLQELQDALQSYAAPYFYFGAHPGDGSDYGYWLPEMWDEEFESIREFPCDASCKGVCKNEPPCSLKVSDLSEVPAWFRGEVAVVNDHGNVTLYNKTARKLTEVWGIV